MIRLWPSPFSPRRSDPNSLGTESTPRANSRVLRKASGALERVWTATAAQAIRKSEFPTPTPTCNPQGATRLPHHRPGPSQA